MEALFLTTFISCKQLNGIISRITTNPYLNPFQQQAIILELKKVVPTCPIIITKDDPK